MKKPIKFLILTAIILVGTYLITGFKEAFNGFNTINITDTKYTDKDYKRFLFFFDEQYGQYIDSNNALIVFTYTLEDGRIELFDSMEDDDPFNTLYVVRSGLYSKTNNIYFYLYS